MVGVQASRVLMVFYIIDTLNLMSAALFVVIGIFKTKQVLQFYNTLCETAKDRLEYGLVCT